MRHPFSVGSRVGSGASVPWAGFGVSTFAAERGRARGVGAGVDKGVPPSRALGGTATLLPGVRMMEPVVPEDIADETGDARGPPVARASWEEGTTEMRWLPVCPLARLTGAGFFFFLSCCPKRPRSAWRSEAPSRFETMLPLKQKLMVPRSSE